MGDIARSQRARVFNQYLEEETIERVDWPAKAPDLILMDYMHGTSSRGNY